MSDSKEPKEHWSKRLPATEATAYILLIGTIFFFIAKPLPPEASAVAPAHAAPGPSAQDRIIAQACNDLRHLDEAWAIIAELRHDRDLLIAAVPKPDLALVNDCVSHPEKDTCRLACLTFKKPENPEDDISRDCTWNVRHAIHTSPADCQNCN